MTENSADQNNDLSEDTKLVETKLLVENLFETIHSNQDVPDLAKTIIKNLNSYYLKIALETPNLFAFDSHQARVFLNRICELSIEWDSIDDKNNKFLEKLASIAVKIKEQKSYNNQTFVQYQKDLEKFLERLKNRALIRKKRNKEKELAQEKTILAKELVAKALSQKISAFSGVSEYIENLLFEEWARVLELLYIRSGPESKIFKSNLEFVDLLFATIFKNKNKEVLKLEFKAVIEKYHHGLSLIAFYNLEIKDKEIKLLRYLKSIHKPKSDRETIVAKKVAKPSKVNPNPIIHAETVKNIKSEIIETPTVIGTSKKKAEEPSVNSNNVSKKPTKKSVQQVQEQTILKPKPPKLNKPKVKAKAEKIEVDYNKLISSFKKGSWIEVFKTNESSIKAKLSWVSPISGIHLFVDSQGKKVANIGKPELIKALKNNTIKIIN